MKAVTVSGPSRGQSNKHKPLISVRRLCLRWSKTWNYWQGIHPVLPGDGRGAQLGDTGQWAGRQPQGWQWYALC